MSSAKRHHYLPQFYLRGFCRDDSFWVYDRYLNEFREQTPINTTVQTHYYSYKYDDGTVNTDLEELLSKIESGASPIIEKSDAGHALSINEKELLSLFVSLQIFRVPDHKKRHEEIRRGILDKLGDDVAPASPEEIAEAPSIIPPDEAGPRISAYELVQNLKELENEPELAHNDFLRMIFPKAIKISNIMEKMSWVIVHAPEDTSFVTTDCPFRTLPPTNFDPDGLIGYGIATPGSSKIMPLSSRSCLFILDEGHEFGHVITSRKNVRDINISVATSCDRFLIATDEEHAKYLVRRSGIDKRGKGPRIIIE